MQSSVRCTQAHICQVIYTLASDLMKLDSPFRINNLDELHGMGLYLNDLNPHGLSREMVLAGWQHCSRYVIHLIQQSLAALNLLKLFNDFKLFLLQRIELMFEKEEQRSDELETSLKLADSWKRQGDDLLYSMIPRPVAERLRSGLNTLSTCQNFEEVSVLFAEVEVIKSIAFFLV